QSRALSRPEPWIAKGVSRTMWYKRQLHREKRGEVASTKLPHGPAPNGYVFPSDYIGRGDAPFGDASIPTFVQKLGKKWNIKFTAHGFRSTLKDWCRANNHPEVLYELQVAHEVRGNVVAKAYGHDNQLEPRRKMMEAWDRYCNTPPAPE